MNLKRFALLSCLSAGLLFSTFAFAPAAYAQTTVQVSHTGSTYAAQGSFVKNAAPLSGIPAFVTVADDSNNLYFVGQTTTVANGMYQIEWTMPPTTPSGTYTVKVSIDGDVQTAQFTYTADETDDTNSTYWGSAGDDGPIRFTGELNKGKVQAVISSSDTGLNASSSGTVDNVTLDTAKAKSVIRFAPYGATYLTISVPNTTDVSTTVSVPGDVISQMISSFGPKSHLLVATQQGSYDLPLDALTNQLLNHVESYTDGKLVFRIARFDRYQQYLNQIQTLGAQDLRDPFGVSFELTASYGGQSLPITDFGNSFVSYSINLTGARAATKATQSALMVNPKNNTLVPAPSVLYHDSVGHLKLVITRTGNGMYYPIEANRTFNDLWWTDHRSEIEYLASRGIISGTSATTFDPNGQITRAQFATLMVRALGLSDKQGSSLFSDVPRRQWFTDYVAVGSSLGLISGYNNYTFGPNDSISREQVAALLARGLQFVQTRPFVDTARVLSPITDQSNIDSWARDDVALALQTGILDGGATSIQPRRLATRAESAHMLYNLLHYLKFIQ
ncbi:MAG: S-layer homology domain-containing protein [Tumebacillaceae bacterium]